MNQGELDSAYSIFRDYQQLLKEDDFEAYARSEMKIGAIKGMLGEIDGSDECFLKSLELGNRIMNDLIIGDSYNNLATNRYISNNLDSAFVLYQLALDSYQKTDDKAKFDKTLVNVSAILNEEERFDETKVLLLPIISEYKNTDRIDVFLQARLNLAVALINLEDYSLALSELEETLSMAEAEELADFQKDILFNIGIAQRKTGEYDLAIGSFDKYHSIKDSLYGAETALKIEQIQAEFELAKEEAITARQALATKEKELKNTELQLTIFGIIGFVVLLAGIALAWYTRKKAVQQAQTQAILDTKEAENKRVTDLFWKEIGLSSKEKKLILQGRELPEHTIPGAIAAAKFLSNQRHNPFLQLGLVEAVDHLLQNLFLKSSCNYHFEYIPIKLEKDGRLFSYRVIEDVLTHVADSCKEGDVKVSIEEKGKDLICRVSANQLNPTEDLNLRSAEARLSLVKGKVKQKEKEGITEFKIEIPKVKVGLEEVKG